MKTPTLSHGGWTLPAIVGGLLLLATPASARIIYVKWDATGANDGTSWANAHVYLQDALAASAPWDHIWVAAGLYTPDMGAGITPGDREASFVLRSTVFLIGGFAGAETDEYERDWMTNITALNGDLLKDDGPDFTNREDNSRHVVRVGPGNFEVNSSGLDGFTIRGGYASDNTTETGRYGGGVLLWDAGCIIRNCTLVDNWAHYGGGIGGRDGDTMCSESIFLENRAQIEGGGAFTSSGRLQLNECRFERNHAPRAGGASVTYNWDGGGAYRCTFIDNDDSGLEISADTTYAAWAIGCDFTRNTGPGLRVFDAASLEVRSSRFIGNMQGGLHARSVNIARVVQSLFSGNTGVDGAAILVEDSTLRLVNCTLSENSATGRGGGVFLAQTAGTAVIRPALLNSILWGNRDASGEGETAQIYNATPALIIPALRYSCIMAGWSGEGAGNIALNPLFVDADGPDEVVGTPDDDLHLTSGSPAIDAGDNVSAYEDYSIYDDYDIDGEDRFEDVPEVADTGNGWMPFIDMGPYERPGRTVYLSNRAAELDEYGYGALYVPEGGTADFWVWLMFDPGAPLTLAVTFDSGDPDISVASGAQLTFDSSNWYDAQFVTGTAAQDADGGWGRAMIRVTGPGLSEYFVEAIEVDDEPQELLIANTPLYVPEGGEAAFTVALALDPGAPMTFQCENLMGDPDLQLRDATPLVFDSSNYSIPQPVWVVARQDADSSNGWTAIRVYSGLETYVDVYEVDDDHSFEITGAPVSVPEGDTGTFYVRPEGGFVGTLVVTTAWQSGDPDISVSAGQTLTFTPEDAGTPQSVTLSGAPDADDVNGTAILLISAPDWPDAQVIANEVDDDRHLIVSPTAVSVPENSTATMDVRLAAAPAAPVTVDTVWISGDADLSVVGGAMLSFDATNFDQPQIVTLSAADDADRLTGAAQFAVRAATYDDVLVTATEVDDEPYVVFRVNAGAAPGGDGASWATAYRQLQDALAMTLPGDQLWVATGVYKPDQGGNRSASFALRSGVALYGGFAGTESALEQRAGLFATTILSGDLAGNDTQIFGNNAENSYHVVAARDLTGTVILDGFTIQSGNANSPVGGLYGPYDGEAFGGGMQIVRSSPVIRNCTFQANSANYGGGALLAWDQSSLVLSRCNLMANRSGYFGGGAFVAGAATTAQWTDCKFVDNTAVEGGAAMSSGVLGTTYTNCLFSGNSAQRAGGGLHITGGSPAFVNCTIARNSQNERYGAGVFVYHSSPTFNNCILWHNWDGTGTDGLAQIHNANPPVNFPEVNYSCVEGGWDGAGGIGNRTVDPMFADPDGHDFTLLDPSPVIDAGINSAVPSGVTTDLNGSPRFVDAPTADTGVGQRPIVDMGAYENQTPNWIEFRGLPIAVPEGGAAGLEIRLTDPPVTPITVTTTWIVGDPDIGVAQGAVLIFDAANYDQWQSVTLAAALDADRLAGTATFAVSAAAYPAVNLLAVEVELGDVNCDGSIDFFDIDPFLLALFDPATYPTVYANCDIMLADVNGDDLVDHFDIDPFLDVLFGL